jgi:hypothetical protein
VLLTNQNSHFSGISTHSNNFNLLDKIIIDSGATDHMFGNQTLLNNLDITNYNQFVLVANGMKAKINGIGETIFCNKKIYNVLYLETFPINLISVQKLTQELNCDVIFSCKTVIFQDRETGTKIGE